MRFMHFVVVVRGYGLKQSALSQSGVSSVFKELATDFDSLSHVLNLPASLLISATFTKAMGSYELSVVTGMRLASVPLNPQPSLAMQSFRVMQFLSYQAKLSLVAAYLPNDFAISATTSLHSAQS